VNYITTAQNQGLCQSCWAFAATALIESMVRIEHGVWSKRSEADVHDGVGAACESVGNAEETLAWVAGQGSQFIDTGAPAPGIADWPCDPYEATLHQYEHCADRSGRATHIPYFQSLGVIEDQKRWLDQYGPLIATFILYSDFGSWKPAAPDSVYSWDGVSESTGNHITLIVGYDDDKKAWIMKNSWGTGWGIDGFVYFA
jgi:C1A family cysteine protease